MRNDIFMHIGYQKKLLQDLLLLGKFSWTKSNGKPTNLRDTAEA